MVGDAGERQVNDMTVNGANHETNQRLQRLEDGQDETNRRLDKLETGQDETNRRLDKLETGQDETNRRLDKLETGQDELRAGQDELRAGQDELRAGQDELRAGQKETNHRLNNLESGHEDLRAGQEELRETVARIDRNLQALRDDIGPLKAAHAANGARKATYRICLALGLTPLGILDENGLAKIIHVADTSGISANELDSFLGADAVIQAADQDGATHYVAVEASFTADERDTRRATRNASLLTRFTGMPAHAVVAARRIDNRIRPVLESGAVHWRELSDDDLQVE